MKIAVTYNNGDISLGFGKNKEFKIYEIKQGEIVDSFVIETDVEGHVALAEFLYNNYVDAVICRNIGAGARFMLANAQISYFAGVTGKCDEAVEKFLKGELVYEQSLDKINDAEPCATGSCNACHGCH